MKEYTSRANIATKQGFGEGVLEAAIRNDRVSGIGSDITSSVGMNLFAEKFPERFFSFGIAEQNCVGIAAGMALSGRIPVFSTYGVFAAMRTTDQIRVSVCYNNLHVIIGGAHAGISVGPDGATHQALEDISIMRAIPGMTVLSPCDATQTAIAVIEAVEKLNSPVYIRFGRAPVPDFTDKNQKFVIGKSQTMKTGHDIAIIATGHTVWPSLQAAYLLEKSGINAEVINMHTIKPIDKDAITEAALKCGAILTAEEHQITGGLGSAVSEVVVKTHTVPMDFIGINDSWGESGEPDELMEKFGLTAKNIAHKAELLFHKKNKQ